jgi:CTP:molybdopterin cytidylyltransferase MocA
MSLGDRPVIRHVVQTALNSGLDPATVVVGPDREAFRAALERLPVRIVGNDPDDRPVHHPLDDGAQSALGSASGTAFAAIRSAVPKPSLNRP